MKKNKPLSHIAAGTITGLVAIALFVYYYLRGLSFRKDFVVVMGPYFLIMAMIIFFVILWGRAKWHNVSFGNLFGYGFRTTIIFVLLMSVFLFSINYIFPEYKGKYISVMTSQINMQHDISEVQKKTYMKFAEDFFNISIVGGALFMNLISGTFAALIGAAFARKNPTASVEKTD